VHSEYSLLDGLSRVDNIFKHIKENGMDAVAISDHGVMYGVIEFYKKAKKAEVKPIIGMEAYTTNVDHKLKPERGKFKNFHQLLLAINEKGYKNLMKLTSIAHLEGYYYRPRVDRETLAKYSEGLICTSTCPQGELPQMLIEEGYIKAKKVAQWFLDVFGQNYYLEIQRHGYSKFVGDAGSDEIKRSLAEMQQNEDTINIGLIKLSRELGIPLVATNDAHYIKKEDASAQDALVCIATGKNVSDFKRLRFIDTPDFYLKTPSEMKELFLDLPDALENTVKIADQCEVSITLNKWFFPKYEIKEGKTPEEVMEENVWKGIKEKVPNISQEIKERLTYEMDIIKEKGYATYFLIVSDMAKWATEHGIVTNTRGSAAGSLVSYSMGIININPLNYELPFERFLTPWRPSPPDIDFDISDNRREEVIGYITQKYGKDRVAQICTFGRMLARGSVRDVARVLGYPYSLGDRIAKAIPIGSQGFPMTIDKALEEASELKNMYKEDEDAKKVIDLAKQIEGNARHVSVHAAGVVIAPDDIVNYTPIQLDPEGLKVITQYDMDALDPNVSPNEAVGLLKFDLLGLRNLSILGAAIEIVRNENAIDIDLQKIPLDDKTTFDMLSHGETMGVFQLSGSGMTRFLKELKPTRVEDLMAMVALYRPGPMAQIPEYIERKNNPEKVKFFDERMREFLGKSYGLLVYQDDVFATAIKIAGYTWEEADKFRKAVGKKIPQEMEKQRQKFVDGAVTNGMDKEKAMELFKLIEPFSGYGFNKSHAASYGIVAYWTAYMKANYPVEFMCALLTAESGDIDKVSAGVNECRRMGIYVLAPDINESSTDFTIVEDKKSHNNRAIRFGLNAIKNVGKAAIEAIFEERNESAFISYADFLARVDARRVNKKVVESLIKVGALSRFGTRAVLLAALDEVRSKVAKPKGDLNQQGLFSSDEIKISKKDDFSKNYLNVEEFSDEEVQSLERSLLGFSLSAKPVSEIISAIIPLATHRIVDVISEEIAERQVKIAAVVSEVRIIITKKSGQEMAFVKVKDDTGVVDLVVFPRIFSETKSYWVDNNPLLITGKVDTREDERALIVDSIETEEIAKEKNEHLFIRIPNSVTAQQLKKLKELLLENPGFQKVSLKFDTKDGKIVDLNIRVSWGKDLAGKISEIFEKENTFD